MGIRYAWARSIGILQLRLAIPRGFVQDDRRSRDGSFGGFAGGWFVVGGVDHDAAMHAFAVAFGVKVGLVAEGEVDDAALARGHGSEVVGSSGAANVIGGDGGGGAEFFEAHAALILAVERNFFVLAAGKAKDFEREKFEGAEKFSAAIEEKSGIGSGQVDENFGALPVAVLRQGRVDGDAVFEVEASVGDYGLEEFVDLFGGGEFVGNGHGNLALGI